ncbi:GNAT family N-acetyltransferase [Novosphingobium album (ex Hu et al. 2023)]|uniref:GNAT family N-acetyltransferase n=1 Tax=Novosphingobium album (ex Hu et al. 2023) TaxID=2930093 RepID=A0ABT0AWH9_9SPHN|nr:GNAT family N-acetyltransferase [Novosphingobium album (ex Hu et al. 2023)]MCJ2177125.1 GNAT family N-acetyltransferase [Novosphingobium album (ex Hu et al. 2023)]
MSAHPLDRPVWNMLNGRQASLAVASGAAVRIDPGYGPFAAARDISDEAQAALAALLTGPDDQIWLVDSLDWPVPPGTRVVKKAALVQMVAANPAPVHPGDEPVVLLGDDYVAQMSDLALATQPGPWSTNTQSYGAYYGILREGRLAAMAGVRMRPAPGFCEVSGVCTWPEYRGQGMAATLIRRVMAGITAQGEVPFLHSYAANEGAIRLYQSLGFEIRSEMMATILQRA